MGVGTGSSGSNAGLEFKEKNKENPTDNIEARISIVFSPYTYDFLKNNSNWNYYPTEYFDKYVYLRFMSKMKWTSSVLTPVGPKEINISDVPVGVRLEGPNADQMKIVVDQFVFIDCTTREGHKDIVYLDWDSLEGYLSFAISEVKDCLFRLHKNGAKGKVKFVVTGYEPMEPLVQAFCYLVGKDFNGKSDFKYSGLCKTFAAEDWFANFKTWLDRYGWKPEVEECALFEGCYYGGSEESICSKVMKIKPLFQEEEKKVRPFWKEGNGLYGQVFWEDEWNINWKKNGGATTDYGAHGPDKPIYHFKHDKYKGQVHDGPGITETKMFKDEEPLGCVKGKFYTRRELMEAMTQLEYLRTTDQMGPKWWIGTAPKNGKRLFTEEMLDMSAKNMEADLKYWMENTYVPQKNDYQNQLESIKARKKGSANYDAKEREAWERKAVEDENVSDKWSVGIDEITYHGKTVKKSYFEGEIKKLEKERQEREAAIKRCRDNALLIRSLKVLACIQFAVGLISFGFSAPLAVKTLLIIDTALETCRVIAQFALNEDYTMSQALEEHFLNYLNNAVSRLLLHAPFKKYTKAETKSVNSMFKSPATTAPKPQPTISYQVTNKTASTPYKVTGQTTGNPYVVSQQTTLPTTPKVFKASDIVKFLPKPPKELVDWLGNLRHGINHAEGKAKAYHFLGSAAQAGTFIYTVNSVYSNALFVMNRTEMSQEDAKKLKIVGVDSKKPDEVFQPTNEEKFQPIPTTGGVTVTDAIQQILKKEDLSI